MTASRAATITSERRHDVLSTAAVLKVRKWTVLAVAAVVTTGAVLASSRGHRAYTSHAAVLVGVSPSTTSQNQQVVMATEKDLAGSVAVAEQAAQVLKLNESPLTLLHGLSLSVPLDTTILQFHYSAPSANDAQRRAQALAEAYLAYRQQQSDTRTSAIASLQGQMALLNGKLSAAAAQEAGELDPRSLEASRAQVTALTSQIATLQQQLNVLLASPPAFTGSVIERASLPSSPDPSHRLRNGLLGVFAGLLLGMGAALVHDHFDDRVRGADELESYLSSPVLGTIPRAKNKVVNGPEAGVLTAIDHDRVLAEPSRRLGINVFMAANRENVQTILVTGARDTADTTLVTASLGVMLANLLDRAVVLVSANARSPRLERLFGLPSEPGLTSVLADDVPLSAALWKTDVVDLQVLPAGHAVANPSALLNFARMRNIVSDLRFRAEFVLIDAPSLLTAADAAVLLPACDAVLFVSDGSTTRREVVAISEELRRANARTIGSVVIGKRPRWHIRRR